MDLKKAGLIQFSTNFISNSIKVNKKNYKNFLNLLKVNKKQDIFIIKQEYEKNILFLYECYEFLNKIKKNKSALYFKKKVIRKIFKKINYIVELIPKNKSLFLDLDKNAIVKVSNLYKFHFAKDKIVKILDNINLEIKYGDFVVLLGPSGSGKTTLMNLISGLDKSQLGKISVDGYKLDEMNQVNLTIFRKNIIGYVFQRYGLLPNLTVFENVLMGEYLNKPYTNIFNQNIDKKTVYTKNEFKQFKIKQKEDFSKSRKEKNDKILKILNDLELSNFIDKYPYQLSGGQKQRTSIARIIAKNPKIIFADEPTAAVDSLMAKSIINEFVKINNSLNTTIIIITHDVSISKYANKVIYFLDGKIHKIIEKAKNQEVNNEV